MYPTANVTKNSYTTKYLERFNNCLLSYCHNSAENQLFVFFLHAVGQEGGFYEVKPFHDGTAELLGDVVDYLVAESRGGHYLDEIGFLNLSLSVVERQGELLCIFWHNYLRAEEVVGRG